MNNDETLIRCKRCGKKVMVRNMVYDTDSSLICKDCNIKSNALSRMGLRAPQKDSSSIPKAVEKEKYICTSCNYKFQREKGISFNKLCPFCGKNKVEVYSKHSASSILDEIE